LLRECIVRGDSEGAVKLINSGALDSGNNGAVYGDYLFLAAQKNDTNSMLALFAKGADIHHKQPSIGPVASRTAVHAAAHYRSAQALRLLLDRGGDATKRDGRMLTPFDLSVLSIETPGPVTDMLIEAGAKPQDENHSKVVEGGTHWAMASYQERHGNIAAAIASYQRASQSYERASRQMLGSAKWGKFMNSAAFRSVLVADAVALQGAGVNSNPGAVAATLADPNSRRAVEVSIAADQDKAEHYAAYSKLFADRARELEQSQNRAPSLDSAK
jgi:ankyrin repeat protein